MRAPVIAAALSLAVSATASASPGADLELARGAFRDKDCVNTVRYANPLVYPVNQLSGRDDVFDAHVMLGACVIDARPDEAKDEFRKALQIAPERDLDPLFFAGNAVRSFDDVKADLAARAKKDADAREAQHQKDLLKQRLADLRVVEKHNVILAFLPLGIGQYQNGQTNKAIAFALADTATAGTSLAIWAFLVRKYGTSSSNVKIEDAASVRRLQGIELVTGGLGILVLAYGAYDGYTNYRPNVEVPGSEELLKDLDKPITPKKPRKTSMHWGPIVVPNGAGIGLAWEN